MGACFANNNEEIKTELIPSANKNLSLNESQINCDQFYQNMLCYCEKLNEFTSDFLFNKEKEKLKQKQKFSELKNDILERQLKLRAKKKENSEIGNIINIKNEEKEDDEKEEETEKEKNNQINQVLEDMCIYGNIMKQQIKEEKENNPENFIEINDALNSEENDQELFALGLLADNLQKNQIEVAIEKDDNNKEIEDEEKEKDAGTTCLEFITNGMAQKKKYNLKFDFGEEKNEQYLNDKEKFEELKEQLKEKLSKDYNISKDKIIVTFPQKGSLTVQVIFQSDEFNNLDKDDFISKFKNDPEYSELQNLKEIHSDTLLGACKLKKNQLDPRGNRIEGWGINEMRGSKPYNPPLGWIGIGLNVMDKYDDGDNTWLDMNNLEGEWCVAYHGIGQKHNSDQVKKITGLIINSELKAGSGQVHEDCLDKFHPGKKVGIGVYCTPNIETAAGYAGISEINGISYKTVFMLRVKPDAIRCCSECNFAKDYWVVNGTSDEIRPYRILYKKDDKEE